MLLTPVLERPQQYLEAVASLPACLWSPLCDTLFFLWAEVRTWCRPLKGILGVSHCPCSKEAGCRFPELRQLGPSPCIHLAPLPSQGIT